MAGVLPAVPIPSNLVIRSFTPTLVSVAHNLRRITRSLGTHRWSMDLSWRQLERESMAEIFAFMMRQEGQFQTFQIIIPGHESPRGAFDSGSDSPVVLGAAQTGNSVAITGCRPNITNLLVKGDFLQFTNHTKVYMITEDFSTDGLGEGSVEIYPALQESPLDSEAIVVENVTMSVAAVRDIIETPIGAPLIYNFDLRVLENST